MSFTNGLNALNSASKRLEVIGNNVANANTIGFKAGQIYFSEVFASSQSSAGANAAGSGASTAIVLPQFVQGNLQTTNNALDLAINGQGMFQLRDGDSTIYSRAGQFQVDQEGFIVNPAGARLQGYLAKTDGAVAASTPVDLKIGNTALAATPTTAAKIELNLDSRKGTADPAAFRITDPTSYQNTTAMPIFDSQGSQHALSMFFVKESAQRWQVFASADGTQVGTGPVGTLAFQANGEIDTAATTQPFALSLTLANNAAPVEVTLDMTGTTSLASEFSVASTSSDGRASGRLTGYSVDASGNIKGRYSNGTTETLGQVALAVFNDPQSLRPLGSNGFAATAASGLPTMVQPNVGMAGAIQSGALEQSNVDLTNELVRMIEAQRVYQANAQAIKAVDTILQTAEGMAH